MLSTMIPTTSIIGKSGWGDTMRMNVPRRQIQAKITGAFDKGLAILTTEIMNDCNQYCKVRDGQLETSALIHSVPKEGKIIWQTPYAKRQYWEIRTAITDVNPLATWKWCEYAKANHLQTWQRQAQKLLEMNL